MWRELYRSALLELRPEELQQRIAVAEKAMQERILEIRRDDSSFEEEKLALEDGLRSLRVLSNNECKPPLPVSAGSAQSKATP
jgi:hypothetical protein